MQIDITQIAIALIGLIGAAITTFLIPWLRSKTTAAQQDQLMAWVHIAVTAAEMLYTGSGRGEEKLEYVKNWLAERGITYDEQTIRAAIEAAVWGLKQSQ